MPVDPAPPRVYLVGNQVLGIYELLARFADPAYVEHGISRLSDLHLKVGEPARYRFDSELMPLPEAAPLTPDVIRALIYPLLTHEQVALLESSPLADLDAGYDWGEHGLSFRLNVFRDREGLAAAIRALPRSIPPPDEIGFPEARTWQEIAALRQGLVIVTGVTGCGKSTTIASLLQHLNRTTRLRILTLEDPIEYVLHSDKALVSQREVNRHVQSFEAGLRSGLREDPDVIFVGEMRDRETAGLALTAAETGHLVFSTLHTRDTRGAVTRIVDLFPPERTRELCAQLSFALRYVIGQKLVLRRSGRGRRVAMEVLRNSPAIAHVIRDGGWQKLYSILETQTKEGSITLERHLRLLVEKGEISQEAALQAANTPSDLLRVAKSDPE